jgi:hypothetical protein
MALPGCSQEHRANGLPDATTICQRRGPFHYPDRWKRQPSDKSSVWEKPPSLKGYPGERLDRFRHGWRTHPRRKHPLADNARTESDGRPWLLAAQDFTQ